MTKWGTKRDYENIRETGGLFNFQRKAQTQEPVLFLLQFCTHELVYALQREAHRR
jgi:hypothetical protein